MQSQTPAAADSRQRERKPKRILLEGETLMIAKSGEEEKHAARIAALQTELRVLGQNSPVWQIPGMKEWGQSYMDGQAPATVIKKTRASRYRMPRRLKQKLIERFVSDDPTPAGRPKVMIIAAHQDDESIGAGSRLCTISEAWVVHVTDGAPADPNVALRYGFDTREEYANARRAELEAALDVAGVLPEHRLCLSFVDGEAAFRMVELVLRLADLLDNIEPDIVITHPYEGGHTDHDATAFAVHLACGLLRREGARAPAVLEMTSYHRRDGRRVVHEFLPHEGADQELREVVLSEEAQQRKRQMYDCFTSQTSIMATFSTEIEKFRPAPRYDFTRPPHEGELNYERFGDPYRGHRWRREAEEALAKLKLRRTA